MKEQNEIRKNGALRERSRQNEKERYKTRKSETRRERMGQHVKERHNNAIIKTDLRGRTRNIGTTPRKNGTTQ